MSTYRERREARAARLDEWAEKRRVKSAAAFSAAKRTADAIPFGQPILVDHHSAGADINRRAKMRRNFSKGIEHENMARSMESRAANITAALDVAIYSDDPDAVDALQARIAELEAERARIVAYNASCRAGAPDPSLLDEKQRKDLAVIMRVAAYQLRKGGQFPAYATSNITGRITKDRDRLERLTRPAQQTS